MLFRSRSLFRHRNPNPSRAAAVEHLKSPANGGVPGPVTVSVRIAAPSSSRWCKPLVLGAAGGSRSRDEFITHQVPYNFVDEVLKIHTPKPVHQKREAQVLHGKMGSSHQEILEHIIIKINS